MVIYTNAEHIARAKSKEGFTLFYKYLFSLYYNIYTNEQKASADHSATREGKRKNKRGIIPGRKQQRARKRRDNLRTANLAHRKAYKRHTTRKKRSILNESTKGGIFTPRKQQTR